MRTYREEEVYFDAFLCVTRVDHWIDEEVKERKPSCPVSNSLITQYSISFCNLLPFFCNWGYCIAPWTDSGAV
jgi:hypothetical protein